MEILHFNTFLCIFFFWMHFSSEGPVGHANVPCLRPANLWPCWVCPRARSPYIRMYTNTPWESPSQPFYFPATPQHLRRPPLLHCPAVKHDPVSASLSECVCVCVSKRCGTAREIAAPVRFFSSSSSSPLLTESEQRVGFAVGLEWRAATEWRAECAERRVRIRGRKGKTPTAIGKDRPASKVPNVK